MATKTEVKKVNKGDLALTHSLSDGVKLDAKHIKNIHNFKRTILPGYVVDKKNPGRDYAYYWWENAPTEFAENEFEFLKEVGYEFVNEKDFEVKKWSRAADGRIKSGRYLLMYLTEEKHNERRQDRLKHLGTQLDQKSAGFHDMADRTGLGTWEVRGGREREVVKARSNANALLD